MAVKNPQFGINLRKNDNQYNAGYGQYYPKAQERETISLDGLTKHMADHNSIYGDDVIGGVLFVLRYGSTTYDDVDEAMKKVELAEAKTIGFIMNDVKFEHRGGYYARDKYSYYKYGYSKKGYGYGYGSNRSKDQNPAND